MAEEHACKGLSCPVPEYEVIEKFDYIDLARICKFLEKSTRKHCRTVAELGSYAADLGIKKSGKASVCIDIDIDPEEGSEICTFIYTGPRERITPRSIAALGKVRRVEFVKCTIGGASPSHFVSIENEDGSTVELSPTAFRFFSSAFIKMQEKKSPK